MTNRKKQAILTRQRIIDSTFYLFNEQDFETVTISDICKNAGVSTGNFYNYFNNKEDILFLRFHDFDEYIKKEFVHKEFKNSLDAIRTLIRISASYVYKFSVKANIQILRVQLRNDNRQIPFNDPNRPFHTHLKKLVKNAVKNGELHHSHKTDDITQTILRMIHGNLLDWLLQRGAYNIEKLYLKDLEMLFSVFSRPKIKKVPL